MHAFHHNQDLKLSRLSTENVFQEKKNRATSCQEKIYTSQLCYCSEKNFTFFSFLSSDTFACSYFQV